MIDPKAVEELRTQIADAEEHDDPAVSITFGCARALLTALTERERLRAVAINLNAAVDAMWNDPHRRASNHWPKHERAISAAQQDLKAALSQAQDRSVKNG
jgi:hypothetical protein